MPPTDARTEPVVQEVNGPQLPLFKEYGPINSTESIEWNITRINADDVWNLGYRGEDMVVASNDTGVDYTHPALVNHYRGNLGEVTSTTITAGGMERGDTSSPTIMMVTVAIPRAPWWAMMAAPTRSV